MVSAFARIRDGVTLDKARADLDIVAARLQKDHPKSYPVAQGYRAARDAAPGRADPVVQDDAAGPARNRRASCC